MENAHTGAPLLISPELLKKMDQHYLLREDVESVVDACERTGKYLLNEEKGTRLGHAMAGRLTIWAEYRNLENCRELVNVYAHRMQIVEGKKDV